MARSIDSPSETPPPVPRVVTAAWGFFLAASVLLIVSGLVLASARYEGEQPPDFVADLEWNMRIVGIINVLVGGAIALVVTPMKAGSGKARWALIILTVIAVAINLTAFVIHVGGYAMALIALILAIAALFMMQPSARSYFGVRQLWQ